MHTWQMYVWTGRKYEKPTSDGIVLANCPAEAIKKFGLTDPDYQFTYSRKGYGHFTGRVEARLTETAAASVGLQLPIPADFVLLVID